MARLLGVDAPTICKIRNRSLPINGLMLIRMHEETGLHIKDLRALMGDHRKRFYEGLSAAYSKDE